MNPTVAPEKSLQAITGANPANQPAEPARLYYIDDYPFIGHGNHHTDTVQNANLTLLDRYYSDESEWMRAMRKLADEAITAVRGESWRLLIRFGAWLAALKPEPRPSSKCRSAPAQLGMSLR